MNPVIHNSCKFPNIRLDVVFLLSFLALSYDVSCQFPSTNKYLMILVSFLLLGFL